MTRSVVLLAAAVTSAAFAPGFAWAWGASGHRIIGVAAMQALTAADAPAFLRTPAVIAEIGELAREPDRSKGAGKPHDADSDPGHFVDLTEDGHVFSADGPDIRALPMDRQAYSATLVGAKISLTKAGWLPYTIMDGYEQLVRDMAYWRVDRAMAKSAPTASERAWYVADMASRQRLTIRDLGVWAHYVGDASQPLHTSIHYNGWGEDYPNPKGYTLDPIHGPFEGPFVHETVTTANVKAALPAAGDCGATIQACTSSYLLASVAQVEPLYQLWGQGAFSSTGPGPGRDFAVARVAAGAAMLRDLVARAWRESADAEVGYRPRYKVSEIEGGLKIPFGVMYGDD